jgi:putative FmdB family regulatory protein
MPVYEYRCENGHTFEVVQRMSDDPVTVCEVCGAAVQRVFHPVAVHFKGSGFYTTDYGRKKGSGTGSNDGAGSSSSDSGSGDKKSDSSSGDKSGSSSSGKSESGSSSSSGSGSGSDSGSKD